MSTDISKKVLKFDRTTYCGCRYNAARAYLHPVMTQLTVGQCLWPIVFEGKRAIGVEIFERGQTKVIRGAEIICCGEPLTLRSCCNCLGLETQSCWNLWALMWFMTCPVWERLWKITPKSMCICVHPACEFVSGTEGWRQPWIGLQWFLVERALGRAIT